MTWIKACKIYQTQRGEGAKYMVPKKGTENYDIVKKIFDTMEKVPKKEKVEKEVVIVEASDVVIPPIKKTKVKKVPVPTENDLLRSTIRKEIMAEINGQGLNLTVS